MTLCPVQALTCNLIAIVPPRHDPGLVMRVLTQPEVRLTEVIKNVARTWCVCVCGGGRQPEREENEIT